MIRGGDLAGLLQREHADPRGRRTGLGVILQRLQPVEARLALADAEVDLGDPKLERGGHRATAGHGLEELGAGEPQRVIGAPRLERLAPEQVERAAELGRQVSLVDGGLELRQDRLGLLGVAGLEDRPRGPDLVAWLKLAVAGLAQAVGGLQVLAAEPLLAGEDQRHAVEGLRRRRVGKRGGGELQLVQRLVPAA